MYLLRKVDAGFVNVMLGFWQSVAIFQKFKLHWSPEIENMFSWMSALNFNIELASPECYIHKSGYELRWYTTILCPGAMLLLILTIVLVEYLTRKLRIWMRLNYGGMLNVYRNTHYSQSPLSSPFQAGSLTRTTFRTSFSVAGSFSRRGDTFQENRNPKDEFDLAKVQYDIPFYLRMAALFHTFLGTMFMALCRAALEFFKCSNIDGKYYFDPEPARLCYEPWWWNMFPLAAGSVVMYVIGIPVYTLAMMFKRIKAENTQPELRTWIHWQVLFITENESQVYRAGFEYWSCFSLLWRLMLIVSQIFFGSFVAAQALMTVCLLQMVAVIHNWLLPYSKMTLNRLEETSLLVSSLILLSGLLFYSNQFSNDGYRFLLSVLVILILLACSVAMIMTFLYHCRNVIVAYRDRLRKLADGYGW